LFHFENRAKPRKRTGMNMGTGCEIELLRGLQAAFLISRFRLYSVLGRNIHIFLVVFKGGNKNCGCMLVIVESRDFSNGDFIKIAVSGSRVCSIFYTGLI
jgi:hypothetical protein